jgi:hypothetical protein
MKRSLLTALACAALVCVVGLPALMAQDAPTAETIMEYFPDKVVTFKHSTHQDVECTQCHHMWDGDGPIQKCSDDGCHNSFDRKDKSVSSLYQIIHSKGETVSSCLSCHREEAGDDRDKMREMAGCRGSVCHPK